MPQVTVRPFGELDLRDHLLSRGSRVSDVFSVSLNHFIRPRQYIRWDRKTDLFGCLEVDCQLEMSWGFNWQILWLCPFENSVYVPGASMAYAVSIGIVG